MRIAAPPMHIVTPLTISLKRVPEPGFDPFNPDPDWPYEYHATCVEFPTLHAAHYEPHVALFDLVDDVDWAERGSDQESTDQDPDPDQEPNQEPDSGADRDRDDQEASDYGQPYPDSDDDEGRWEPTWLTEWNTLVTASGAEWDYTIASEYLDEHLQYVPVTREAWAATEVPALVARKFRALLLEPDDAKRLHLANVTPEQALPYVVDAESTGWWNWPDYNIVDWVIVGVPVERVRLYRAGDCDATDAATWEAILALHAIPNADLRDILRAGFTPNSVATAAAEWAEDGHSVGDAARSVISTLRLDRGPIRIVSGRP